MMKTCIYLTAVVLSAALFAESRECIWTGAAQDGKWSSSANWRDGSAPEKGDVVIVSGAYGTDMEMDIEGLSISRMVFDGHDPVHITGKELTIENKQSTAFWTNSCPLVCDIPLVCKSGNSIWNKYFVSLAETHFNGEIKTSDDRCLCLHTPYNTGRQSYHVYFNAPVTGEKVSMLPCGGNFYVYSGVTGTTYITSSSYSDSGATCSVYFYAPIKYGYINIAFKQFTPMGENILDPNSDIRHTGWRDSGILNLNGFNQTVNCVTGDYYYVSSAGNKSPPNSDDDRSITSASPATLTMRATKSSVSSAIVTGAVTLKYAPKSNSYVQTFTHRASTTSGAILLEGGTFRLAEGASFVNVPHIFIGSDATLEIDSENGVANPFPNLKTLEVVEGGKVKLPDGVALTPARVMVKGAGAPDGVAITSEDGWIEGEGTITPNAALFGDSTTVWTGVTGEWNNAGNWTAGAPSMNLQSRIFGLYGQDVSVTVSSDAAPSSDFSMMSEVHNDVELKVNALLPFTDAVLNFGKGAKIEIGEGGEILSAVTTPTGSISDKWFTLNNGVINVRNGGKMTFTDIPGKISIGSNSDGIGDVMNIDQGGKISAVQGAKNAVVEVLKSATVNLAGEFSVARRYGNNSSSIFDLNGGELNVTGSGVFKVDSASDKTEGGVINFNYGDVLFADDSMLRYTLIGSWNSYLNFGSLSATEPLKVTFKDNACISNFIGHLYVSGGRGHGAFLDMSSVNDGFIGNENNMSFYDLSVGYRSGDGKFVYGGSGFGMSLYGLYVGFATDATADKYGSGEMTIQNGANVICGGSCAVNRSNVSSKDTPLARFYGAIIGMWLNTPDSLSSRPEKGLFRMKDAATTYKMESGHFIVGAGCAEGLYIHEDGTNTIVSVNWSFVNGSGDKQIRAYTTNNVFAVGMLGGKGECIISNGLCKANVRTFIGGCHTNEYFDGAYFSYGKNKNTAGLRTAEGALRVVGGNFDCAHTVFVGTDGEGLLEIGPSGSFTADGLVLSNSTASAVKFTFGEDGTVGSADVRKLVVSPGAKFEVDLSGVAGANMKKLAYGLLLFDESEGMFSESDISIVVDDPLDYRLNRAALVRRADGIYLIVPKTGLRLTIR